MSVVIGICGLNFCTFIADTRMISFEEADKYKIDNDKTHKIFKINERVLLGCSGQFIAGESLIAPIDPYVDKGALSVRTVLKAVTHYLDNNCQHVPYKRNYLIGGKDNDGKFCIYEVHFTGLGQYTTTLKKVELPICNAATSCLFPSSIGNRAQEFSNKVTNCVLTAKNSQDLIHKLEDVIIQISDIDNSVGKNTEYLWVV